MPGPLGGRASRRGRGGWPRRRLSCSVGSAPPTGRPARCRRSHRRRPRGGDAHCRRLGRADGGGVSGRFRAVRRCPASCRGALSGGARDESTSSDGATGRRRRRCRWSTESTVMRGSTGRPRPPTGVAQADAARPGRGADGECPDGDSLMRERTGRRSRSEAHAHGRGEARGAGLPPGGRCDSIGGSTPPSPVCSCGRQTSASHRCTWRTQAGVRRTRRRRTWIMTSIVTSCRVASGHTEMSSGEGRSSACGSRG